MAGRFEGLSDSPTRKPRPLDGVYYEALVLTLTRLAGIFQCKQFILQTLPALGPPSLLSPPAYPSYP